MKLDSETDKWQIKISDFGTSINVNPESKNIQMCLKQTQMKNTNRFMTPLYASPAIVQKQPSVNYYLEDVFSLGVSFLQMCGPFSSDELSRFNINGTNAGDLSRTNLKPQLEQALNSCFSLSYFFKALLKKMLLLEADERPTFL